MGGREGGSPLTEATVTGWVLAESGVVGVASAPITTCSHCRSGGSMVIVRDVATRKWQAEAHGQPVWTTAI